MFRGTYSVSLDAKGRLAIPAKFRERLKAMDVERLVVTPDLDRCLVLYPEPVWIQVEQKLQKLPSLKPEVRMLKRHLVGSAQDLEMDAQGRVLLSQKLRDSVGLQRRAALIGQIDKIEIWDEDTWNAEQEGRKGSIDLKELSGDDELSSLVL